MVPTPREEQPGVSLGNTVYTADGRRIGVVLLIHGDAFVVEGGVTARRYFVINQTDIVRSHHGVLTTSLTLDEVKTRERR